MYIGVKFMNINVFTQKQVKQRNKAIKECTLYGKTFCDYFDKAYHSNVMSYAFKSYCKALQIYLDTMKSAVWNYNSKTLSNKNLYKWFLLQNKQSVFELFKDREEASLYAKFIDLILKEDSSKVYSILKHLIIEHICAPHSILTYKGYFTVIKFEAEDKVLYGKIEGIDDLVTFESDSAKEIEKEFHDAVDDWLEFRKEIDSEVESKE
jgi:hypothetical protein